MTTPQPVAAYSVAQGAMEGLREGTAPEEDTPTAGAVCPPEPSPKRGAGVGFFGAPHETIEERVFLRHTSVTSARQETVPWRDVSMTDLVDDDDDLSRGPSLEPESAPSSATRVLNAII